VAELHAGTAIGDAVVIDAAPAVAALGVHHAGRAARVRPAVRSRTIVVTDVADPLDRAGGRANNQANHHDATDCADKTPCAHGRFVAQRDSEVNIITRVALDRLSQSQSIPVNPSQSVIRRNLRPGWAFARAEDAP